MRSTETPAPVENEEYIDGQNMARKGVHKRREKEYKLPRWSKLKLEQGTILRKIKKQRRLKITKTTGGQGHLRAGK